LASYIKIKVAVVSVVVVVVVVVVVAAAAAAAVVVVVVVVVVNVRSSRCCGLIARDFRRFFSRQHDEGVWSELLSFILLYLPPFKCGMHDFMRGVFSLFSLTFTLCWCEGVEVQFSLDHGETWSLVQSECMMGKNIACESYTAASVLTSDIFYDWTRVAIKLPYYTRSEHCCSRVLVILLQYARGK